MNRQYTCFVCNKHFPDYNLYKDHIVSIHEEGKDYVKCPLARCLAPVRDVRQHFKVFHRNEKVPASGQMKALIWKDSRPQGKNGKKFQEGYVTSQKNDGKKMHYRSSWEKDVYMCLEHITTIKKYSVESFPVEYSWKGRRKRYFPDIFVTFTNGEEEVWEIKPSNQKSLEINKAKWMACEAYCITRGWKFKIIDENEIRKLKTEAKLEINLLLEKENE